MYNLIQKLHVCDGCRKFVSLDSEGSRVYSIEQKPLEVLVLCTTCSAYIALSRSVEKETRHV